ncbi:MAG: alkaline phosphatase family protein [Bacteroidota bacterium]
MKIFKKWWFVLIILLLAGGAFYLWKSNTPLGELGELAAEDGDHQLRDELRPAKGGTRLLVFAFDGVGADELEKAIRSRKTSRIAQLLGEDEGNGLFKNGYSVQNAMSILPSTTMAAWSSIYTGKPPAETGVPGNEWFVREEMKFYAPAPVSVTENKHTLQMLNDGLVGNALKVPTIFEMLDVRSYVSLSPIYRGADIFTTPKPTTLAEVAVAVAKGMVGEETVSQEVYKEVDYESVSKLLETIKRNGPADMQVVYFPGIDLYSHIANYPLEKQEEYLQRVLDSAMGSILDVYEKAGILDETYIMFIADHGHTPVLNDDRHALSSEGGHEPPDLLKKLGWRVRPFELEPKEEDYQATVAYQGAIAYVYLADRSTCPDKGQKCDWKRGPRLEEDVMPLVRAFYKANETGEGVPELKGTLDLIFAREPRPIGQDALPFKIFDGNSLLAIGEYLTKHPRPDLLNLEERMRGLAAGPYGHRAGDILLLSKSGFEQPVEERYYFSAPYHSWHGSPTKQDSHIPIIIAKKGSSGQELQALVNEVAGQQPSQLDIVPIMKRIFNKKN